MSLMYNQSKQLKRRRHRLLNNRLKTQRGVAIIIALFIMALIATMSYMMMARLQRDTRRTTLIVRDIQAEALASGSIDWAMEQLRNNWIEQKPNQLIDIIPIESPINDIDGYKVHTIIYDMQGRYNLNNLANPTTQKEFILLLKSVMPKISNEDAQQIARAISDWVSPTNAQNEFSKYYAELPEPYRAAHRPMISASELRLVKGVTPAIFNALHPFVTALPEPTKVNVQTASAPVLLTLSPSMTLDVANAMVTLREQNPIVNAQQFSNLDVVKNHQIQADKVSVSSKYFLVETDVSIENQHALLYTLLVRNAQDKQASVTMLWQSKGIW